MTHIEFFAYAPSGGVLRHFIVKDGHLTAFDIYPDGQGGLRKTAAGSTHYQKMITFDSLEDFAVWIASKKYIDTAKWIAALL
jgi:hypothetical protein